MRNIQSMGMAHEEVLTLELTRVTITVCIPGRISVYMGASGWIYVHGTREFLPASIKPPVDGAVRPTGGSIYYYIESLSDFGLPITLENLEETSTSYTVGVRVHPCPTLLFVGDFVVAFGYVTKVSVTTVGWIDRGSPTVYFQHYTMPIHFTFSMVGSGEA